ncbi:hypothetical protein KP509_24G071000 [Ceratopteris richardii]|uniref:Peptide methionine sulfoxide reductase A5 n=1 Tax=Ceratopteris richardii TaxID=49495 RepID=A0A8T2RVW2_CERRI|nr:hypothetical protein KP509_24G071000 [Ceratopteris richardii]
MNLLSLFVAFNCGILMLFQQQGSATAIRVSDTLPADSLSSESSLPSKTRTAVFALGSFWHSEAVFGCLDGVLRTTAGYAGGSKLNPEYRNIGDQAEAVEVEFNPEIIRYEQLLDVFWTSHDPTQVFGQGPDVGSQYRSAIYFQGQEQENLALLSKTREEAKLSEGQLTTEIKPIGIFFPAESEHQKFELRRNSELMQLLGSAGIGEDLSSSRLGTRLNAYAAGMCSISRKKEFDHLLENFLKWRSNLREIAES